MKRIYQGKVIAAELLQHNENKAAKEKVPDNRFLENWDEILWEHYALFQDAVNYYLVALLAMSTSETNPLYKIRCYLSGKNDYQIWKDFRRKGSIRPGMCRSVAKYLTPDEETPSLEKCFNAILDGNNSSSDILDLALCELMQFCSGEGAIQQEGRSMLPRFCDPEYSGQYPIQKAAKDEAQMRLATYFYEPENCKDLKKTAKYLQYEWFVNPAEGSLPKTGEDAKKLLQTALDFLCTLNGEIKKEREKLETKIKALKKVEIPAYTGGSINKEVLKRRFYAYLLFVHVDASPMLFNILRDTYKLPREKKKQESKKEATVNFLKYGDDPIKLSRGDRGFVFRAFTSLDGWHKEDNNHLPVWKEFDISAFKEALKTIHQIDLKEGERDKERGEIQQCLDYMMGKTKSWKGEDTEDTLPSRIDGDPRIACIENIIKKELSAEYDMVEGEEISYGLQERTIRGFREIKKKWRIIVKAGDKYSEQKRELLLKVLREFQTNNPERIGSVALFEKFTEKKNWIIWQEPEEALQSEWNEKEYAEDPLDALLKRYECEEKLQRLKLPVRLTPADPLHSGRQYMFSDWKTGCKHEQGVQSVRVACAIRNPESALWECRTVRLRYSAPRMLRDGLKNVDDEEGIAAAWSQPMMAALMPDKKVPLDFNKAALGLIPVTGVTGERRFLLNFPVDIEEKEILDVLGSSRFCDADFIQFNKQKRHLRWFADKGKTSPAWKSGKPFTCLAADLGQRDAAAFAIVEATTEEHDGKGRFIGDDKGVFWYAHLKQIGLARLPGEDARVWRDGLFQTELSGERGRTATNEECQEALTICNELHQDESVFGADMRSLSFPELNDKLLVVMRRAQSRLARFHTWAWMIDCGKSKREEKTLEEIRKDVRLSDRFRGLAEKGDRVRLKQHLIQEIHRIRPVLVLALQIIANRILPRRDALWVWRGRNESVDGHVLGLQDRGCRDGALRIRGQRGLSLERIEQVEELRRRCQSLNRSLMHIPGEKPVMGRCARGIDLQDPCPEILEKLDALREQRVNQTAHLIVAEALGVRLRKHAKTLKERWERDVHGEYERIPGRAPVDLVVLEDLSRYLSSQDRPRRENSRLMKWCHRAILGKVKELCEPYGIPVLETPAAWSSRFSSRDGTPGFRAIELTPKNILKFPWRQDLQRVEEVRTGVRKVDIDEKERLENIERFFDVLVRINEDRMVDGKKMRSLVAPMTGGPLFVPMNGALVQADINAAVNLALRAIASPRAHAVHPRVRTVRDQKKDLIVRRDTVMEKQRWQDDYPVKLEQEDKNQREKQNRNPNYFVDLDRIADYGRASIEGINVANTQGLWGTVKRKAWQTVNRLNNDRLEKWGYGRPLNEDEAIPY